MQKIVIACEDLFGIEVYSIICEINKRRKMQRLGLQYEVAEFISDKKLCLDR